jgi:(p)ppGpp synthase/HD superfamily hydrolase
MAPTNPIYNPQKTRYLPKPASRWLKKKLRQVKNYVFPNSIPPGLAPAMAGGPAIPNIPSIPGANAPHIHYLEGKGSSEQSKPTGTELIELLQRKKYKNIQLIRAAYEIFSKLEDTHKERNIRIALLLTEWEASTEAVAASLLIDIDIPKGFSKPVINLLRNVEELNKYMCNLVDKEQKSRFIDLLFLKAQNYEALLLLAAVDLIDLEHFTDRDIKLNKVFRAFSATSWILRYFGFGIDASKLEDAAVLYRSPESYHRFETDLMGQDGGIDRLIAIEKLRGIADAINISINSQGLESIVKARRKGTIQAYKKLAKSDAPDRNGIRVILKSNEAADCYAALFSLRTFLKSLGWEEVPGQYDDYIANPKKNGYQSIHLIFRDREGFTIEVQIRTKAMDNTAEFGSASHAAYKLGDTPKTFTIFEDIPPAKLRFFDKTDELFHSGTTVVYDDNHNLIRLSTGSSNRAPTLLDFAFVQRIKIGLSAEIGEINGRRSRLGTQLNAGQNVRVITKKTAEPLYRGRIKIVNTHYARAILTAASRGKINLKGQLDERSLILDGKKIFERIKTITGKLWVLEPTLLFSMEALLNRFGFSSTSELYISLSILGFKSTFTSDILDHITNNMVMILNPAQKKGERTFVINQNSTTLLALLKQLKASNLKVINISGEDVPETPYSTVSVQFKSIPAKLEGFIFAGLEDINRATQPSPPQHGKKIRRSLKLTMSANLVDVLINTVEELSDKRIRAENISVSDNSDRAGRNLEIDLHLPRVRNLRGFIEELDKNIKGIKGVRSTEPLKKKREKKK